MRQVVKGEEGLGEKYHAHWTGVSGSIGDPGKIHTGADPARDGGRVLVPRITAEGLYGLALQVEKLHPIPFLGLEAV